MILLKNNSTNETIAYFNNDMKITEKILKWVENNLENELFGLTESWNCSATLERKEGIFYIHISGDNDYKDFELVQLDKIVITL